jgi:putative DNA primase/helicase
MSDDDFMSPEIRAEWEEHKEQLRRKKPRAERSNGEAGDELITVCAATITPRRINWFWRDRFARGKVGVLGGHPDEGKSLILADMIARATRGSNWPCGEGQAPVGNVIMLTAEDDLGDTVIPRLIAAGADLNRVHLVPMVRKADGKNRTFSLLTDLEMLERKITEIGSVVLVGIDPLSAYFGIGKMDTYRTSDVRGVMAPLATLAQEHNPAIVGVMHFNKNVSVTNAMLRFSDSLAFVAASRHAFVVTRDPDDQGRRLFLKAKNNLAAESKGLSYLIHALVIGADEEGCMDAPCVAWGTEHVAMTANEALTASAGSSDEPSATDDCIHFLKVELVEGPVPVREVERRAVEACLLGEGKSLNQSKPFRQARKELGIISSKGGLQEGWTLAMPKKPWPPEDAL